MFALSTAWNADKWQDGERIAEEIHNLGIKEIELNFSLTRSMVEDIFRFTGQNNISITSLHNYCPIPEGLKREEALPDCFSLSSLDEDERKKAVDFTKRTIATAQRVRARAVVLHCGRVEIPDKTRQLIDLYIAGEKENPSYKDMRDSFVRERRANSKDYFFQILKSLDDLSEYAQRCGIVLGIENRFYYREIPSLEEMETVFDRFKNKNVAYWHDVGHGYILEKLGFYPEGAYLKKCASNLYGIHLHNIKGFDDHQSPSEGEFDMTRLKPYMRRDTLKVIEVHSDVPAQAITQSVAYLTEVLGG